jgi:hypothetical protein
MGRGYQLTTALLINVVVLWRFRASIKFYVVLFGQDADTWQALQRLFAPEIRGGLLVVCSGGDAGCLEDAAGRLDAPPWMPPCPADASPVGSVATPPFLRFWHASWAKNSSHLVACFLAEDRARLVLVNVDADNMLTADFVRVVAREFKERIRVPGVVAHCTGVEGALTGRLAYWAQDFYALRGYDTEETAPAAGEDCDLRTRLISPPA